LATHSYIDMQLNNSIQFCTTSADLVRNIFLKQPFSTKSSELNCLLLIGHASRPLGCRLVTGRYVLRVLYGENRLKSENWATLKPRSSATVRPTKKLTRCRKLPGPWTTTWNKQYLSAVYPLTCSLLWVRYLFDPLKVWGFGANDPWMETFHKFLSEFCVSPTTHVSWLNLEKIGR